MTTAQTNSIRHSLAVFCLCALFACDLPSNSGPGPITMPEPADVAPQSQDSLDLAAYYAGIQSNFLVRGLLRDDGGTAAEPFSSDMLAKNFKAIALSEEFSLVNGRLLAGRENTQLNKWQEPISVKLVFGRSVPLVQRQQDRTFISTYLTRLSRITGHSINLSSRQPNFIVYIINEDERLSASELFTTADNTIDGRRRATLFDMQKDIYCRVLTEDKNNDGSISFASALVRGEHPDRMRHACFHEEIAQGLGLFNDSPKARPSIFNDDEEFGLLTTHDELLLRILYDPRLIPGMEASQAARQAKIIAGELLGGPS